jgi:uncharacterized protein YraI
MARPKPRRLASLVTSRLIGVNYSTGNGEAGMATEDIDIQGVEERATAETTALAEQAGTAEPAQHATAASAAAAVTYPVAPGVRLNVRSGPGTQYSLVRVLPEGASVPIYCQRPGQTVAGPYGTTNLWDCIANAQYVSDAYVHTGSDGYVAPRCG